MQNSGTPGFLMGCYNLTWKLALPVLKKHHRLKAGLSQRVDASGLPPSDIWIQAASAGESYLAAEILEKFSPDRPTRMVITTTTSQGRDILTTALSKGHHAPQVTAKVHWFPFDLPKIMETALDRVRPGLMILLETELWPGMLHALKSRGIPILILNARMSDKSFFWYMKSRKLWNSLAPDRIMAISSQDARRYEQVFPGAQVETMSNIKFDAIFNAMDQEKKSRDRHPLIPPKTPLTILASVRKEEEEDVEKILTRILDRFPNQVVALFPRHMHRLIPWQKRLEKAGLAWRLKSMIRGIQPPGTVILWDTFGELKKVYSHGTAAFVGGSLAPLGGQNFLEPMLCGTHTVTGPHLKNFSWVGEEVFTSGLAVKAADWEDVADHLIQALTRPLDRPLGLARGKKFLEKNQGGLKAACKAITLTLKDR